MMGRGWWRMPFHEMTFLGGSVIIALLTLAAVGAHGLLLTRWIM